MNSCPYQIHNGGTITWLCHRPPHDDPHHVMYPARQETENYTDIRPAVPWIVAVAGFSSLVAFALLLSYLIVMWRTP